MNDLIARVTARHAERDRMGGDDPIQRRLTQIKWMLAATTLLLLAVLWQMLTIKAKLP